MKASEKDGWGANRYARARVYVDAFEFPRITLTIYELFVRAILTLFLFGREKFSRATNSCSALLFLLRDLN